MQNSINLIWAQDKMGGIAKNQAIPWHLKEDFAFFKAKTADSHILMGSKTYESLPLNKTGNHLLPNRENWILTRTPVKYFTPELLEENDVSFNVISSISNCLNDLKNSEEEEDKLYVIGGKQIYQEFIDNIEIDRIFVTSIDEDYECDLFAPNLTDFELISASDWLESEVDKNLEGNALRYKFLEFGNKKI